MSRRLSALVVPLALSASGFGSADSFSAPLTHPILGEGTAFLQRIDLRKTHNPPKHCLSPKETKPCPGVGAAPNGARAGSAALPGTLPLPSSLPPGASVGPAYGNHRVEPKSAESQAGSSSGLKFTGGVGVPTKRATLEGALSPYQQPNGNTSASTSGKLTNGIEEQGMHFGLEWHY